MPYSFKIAQEAEDDILEAYIWYQKQKPGLGEEFLEDLSQAFQAILRNPETYRFRFKKARLMLLIDFLT
jgi:toxin ParE1/3/4